MSFHALDPTGRLGDLGHSIKHHCATALEASSPGFRVISQCSAKVSEDMKDAYSQPSPMLERYLEKARETSVESRLVIGGQAPDEKFREDEMRQKIQELTTPLDAKAEDGRNQMETGLAWRGRANLRLGTVVDRY